MRRAPALALVLVIATLLFSTGCDRCGRGPRQGPPGPIVDIDPNPGTSKSDWYVTENGTRTPQTSENMPDIYPGCELRTDFIGKKDKFEMCTGGTAPYYPGTTNCQSDLPNVKEIVLTNPTTGATLTLTHTAGNNQITWVYYRRALPFNEMCVLNPVPITTGRVPADFPDFTEVRGVNSNGDSSVGKDLELRVNYVEISP